jgi:hypothetical protein
MAAAASANCGCHNQGLNDAEVGPGFEVRCDASVFRLSINIIFPEHHYVPASVGNACLTVHQIGAQRVMRAEGWIILCRLEGT